MYWDMRVIGYFIKTAETHSFSRAAQELHISTQALNRQIILLEKQLGERLFDRHAREVQLTSIGKLIYEKFLPVMLSYEATCQKIDEQLARIEKTINISFFDALPRSKVISPVAGFLMRQNATNVKLTAVNLDDTIEHIQTGQADLCLLNKVENDAWEGTRSFPLAHMPAQVVVSLGHDWSERTSVDEADLREAPILLMQAHTGGKPYRYFYGLRSGNKQLVPDFTTMLAELDLGRHYAIFPRLFDNAQFSKLRFIDLPEQLAFNYELACVYRSDNRFAPLFESMREHFAAQPIKADF